MARDYSKLWLQWTNCHIMPAKESMAINAAKTILKNADIYSATGISLSIPWFIIGVLHFRESSFDFKTHLANGDPLFDQNGRPLKTTHVPIGLGPFNNWKDAALGAIKNAHWGMNWHWDIVNALENVELYNGLGYYRLGVTSPYVWAGTNIYQGGMYVSDGNYDPIKYDQRIGCAAIFKALIDLGVNITQTNPTVQIKPKT